MPRALLTLLGTGLVLVVGGVLVVVGPAIDVPMGVFVACTACAGVAFVVAGRRERVRIGPWSVPWYVFAGVGDIALAVGALAVALPSLLGVTGPQVGVVFGSVSSSGGIGTLAVASVGIGRPGDGHGSEPPRAGPNR
jgi:hypothetical protein